MPRIVLITGAAAGIGLAIARDFARRGDTVTLSDIDATAAVRHAKELGPQHFGLHLDVGNEASIVGAVATIAARLGRIDVLVNNAGVVDAAARPALEIPLADVARLLNVNLRGSYLVAREAGRLMLAQGGGGVIVNIASGAALAALPGRAAYGMSKAAVLGLTRALAAEWAGRGVRVNAVLPGYVETEILAALRRAGRFDAAAVERAIPLGRLADPREIGAVVRHVAGATYMTGASLSVDGGVAAFGGSGPASTGTAPKSTPGGVTLVTGGATGIGAAIADRCVAEGGAVVVLDRDAGAVAALPPDRIGIVADVTDPDAVADAVATVERRLGPVGTLVNNAGVADGWAPTVDQRAKDFDEVMSVDLVAILVFARAVAPGMIRRGGGSIVNLSSIAATGGLPRRNAYCAAKAGVSFLTRSLACEWAAHGIRVNAVAPGYIATPGVERLARDGHRDLAAVRRRIPMGRLGIPAEIADTVAFLASPAASYVTGAVWAVDGGYGAYGDVGPASTEQSRMELSGGFASDTLPPSPNR